LWPSAGRTTPATRVRPCLPPPASTTRQVSSDRSSALGVGLPGALLGALEAFLRITFVHCGTHGATGGLTWETINETPLGSNWLRSELVWEPLRRRLVARSRQVRLGVSLEAADQRLRSRRRFGSTSTTGTKVRLCPRSSAMTNASASRSLPALMASAHSSRADWSAWARACSGPARSVPSSSRTRCPPSLMWKKIPGHRRPPCDPKRNDRKYRARFA